MKRFLILAALVAVAVGGVANVQATQRKVKNYPPITWVKANGSGSTTTDSTFVNILFVAATNGSDPDTTAAFDLRQVAFPLKVTATDSMIVVAANVHWAAPSTSFPGASTELATDSVRVSVQYSADGTTWSTQQVVQMLGASNTQVATYRLTNRVAAMDGPIGFVRWIVQNYDQSLDAGQSGHAFWLMPAVVVGE